MPINIIYKLFLFTILSVALVGAVTIITDQKVDSPTASFSIIDMPDTLLVFTDSVNNRIMAIFNGNVSFNQAQAEQQGLDINTGMVSFLGDVNNFDDINGFSRFKETNLNNGSFASAGFSAVNDIGHTVNFGIGSSNFNLAGEDLSNQPAILSSSVKGFDFINALNNTLWRWRVGDDNNLSTLDRTTVMELDDVGNLEIAGNYTGDNAFIENHITANFTTLETFAILKPTFIGNNGSTIHCNIILEGSLG